MADFKPGDNNKNNTLNGDAEGNEAEYANNLEPLKPAETAGLSVDELGINAKQTREMQDPTNPENTRQGPDAQTLNNQQQSEETLFTASPSSNQIAMDQINKGLQGATDGLIAGVIGAESQAIKIQEEEKEKQRRVANVLALSEINNIQELAIELQRQSEALQELQEEMRNAGFDIEQLNAVFEPRIQEMQELLDQQQQELQDLRDRGAGEEEIALKEMEIANTEKLLTLYKDTHSSLATEYSAASTQLSQAQEKMNGLQERIDSYTDKNQAVPQELLQEMESIQLQVKQASDQVAGVEKHIAFSKDMMEISAGLHQQISANGMQCSSESTIHAQASVIDAVIKFTEDGELSVAEASQLRNMAKDAGFTEAEMADFANKFSDSGLAIVDESGNKISGEEARALIMSEWNKIQEEKALVSGDINNVSSQIDTIKAQLEKTRTEEANLQQKVDKAQENLTKEQTETAQIQEDATATLAILSEYKDTEDYMEKNYSKSIMGVKVFGDGAEDIDDVGKDKSRILQKDGNFVYQDNEDQRLYTLEKNEDGTVKLDANGKQIPEYLSSEESTALRREMYENKLIPRNYAKDGNFAEYSTEDTFLGTYARSQTGFGVEETEEQRITADIEKQKQQEQVAQQSQEQAAQELASAEESLKNANDALNLKTTQRQELEQKLALLQERESELKQEALANNINLEESTEESRQETATSTETSEETEISAPAPEFDAEYSAYLGALEQKIGNGAITPAELDDLLAEAPAGVDAEKIKADLEKQGRLIAQENTPNELEQNTPEQNEPAPSNTVVASYPYIGATAQVQVINTPTVRASENGVLPAIEFTSFADSQEFAATNDPKNPDATYNAPYNNQTNNVIVASEEFGKAPTPTTDQPAVGTAGLTPEQNIALAQQQAQREATLRQQQIQDAQNDPNVIKPNNTAGTSGMPS